MYIYSRASAVFDSHAEEHNPTCLLDTGVDLLRGIDKWIQSPNAEAIFWLHPFLRRPWLSCFLLNPEKRENNQFWIDEKEVHRRLVTQCLRVLNNSLRTDIYQVQAPGTAFSEIDPERIKRHLLPEMRGFNLQFLGW
ncbi:hypothetical protein PG991_009268 [Apiospora marii]|uniref:Uncharacterized protein n=1 Tax=Apiospora marii TaxID=335849 RepID=A0ABR1RK54_9PEZI